MFDEDIGTDIGLFTMRAAASHNRKRQMIAPTLGEETQRGA
jgi:hypothetical protein